jgi:hypothetical protein
MKSKLTIQTAGTPPVALQRVCYTSSKRLWRKFTKAFEHGLAMWTSEDGTMLSITIIVRDDWKEVLQREFPHIFDKEPFDEKRGKLTFIEQEWVGGEYFDGNSGTNRGKVWVITDDRTPYPVINYELQIPR